MKHWMVSVAVLVAGFVFLGGVEVLAKKLVGEPEKFGILRDGNWRAPGPGQRSGPQWDALEAQVNRYRDYRAKARKAEADGEAEKASEYYELAANNAIWSWTQAWQLNNSAYVLAKAVNADNGLSEWEEEALKMAIVLYDDCLEATHRADEYAKKLARSPGSLGGQMRAMKMSKEAAKCRALAARSLEWIEGLLENWVS